MSGDPPEKEAEQALRDMKQQISVTAGNLKKQYFRYLLSSIGSALIMSIYSSVDMICVGQYAGPDGTAALSCVLPLWGLIMSFGMIFGVGGSIWFSQKRGAGDGDDANRYFTVALICGAVSAVGIALLLIFGREPLLIFFGADESLLPKASAYARWISYASPMFLLGSLLSAFVRNDSAPGLCTVATLTGGLFNIFGDIWFVFDFGLGMGMSGAGLATAMGQIIAVLILLTHFLRKRCRLRLLPPTCFFRRFRQIFLAGFSPALVELSFGVTVILFNNQIMRYAGSDELAIFGSVSNIAILIQSLFGGVGQAVQPLAAANYGAGEFSRVRTIRRYMLLTAGGMGIAFGAVCLVFPETLLRVYMSVTDRILEIGPGCFRIYALSFFLMGINVSSAYYLGSILRPGQSLAVSLSRGLIVCGILVFLLPYLFGFSAIWWTMPVTELLTAGMVVWFIRDHRKMPVAG